MKETSTKEIAQNIFLHISKVQLKNTEDLAHTLYTYTVSIYPIINLSFNDSHHYLLETSNY